MNKKYSTSKKTLLVLAPYRFTGFNYYKLELHYLEKKKNYKIIIHDFSNISSNKQYNAVWKAKKEKRAVKITSLVSWIYEFNKIKKKKNILVYDVLDYGSLNFQVFVVKLFLMFSRLPILKYEVEEVVEWRPKKNLRFFLNKIFQHKFNLKVYFSAIRENFFSALIKLLRFNKIFLMTNKNFNTFEHKENVFLIRCHSSDYSNYLLEKYKNSNNTYKKKYIVYLDNTIPYSAGDNPRDGRKVPKISVEKWYKELNLFFDKLEKLFKAKIIIIPHAKNKIPSLKNKNINPYFNNRLSDNSFNAAAKLIPKSLFVISLGSTALSHAVINYKPIQYIYSSNYAHEWNRRTELKNVLAQANFTGAKPIDITSIKKNFLNSNLKVNKAKYDLYKFKYLTYKSAKPAKPNYKIFEELMDKSI